MLGSNLVWTIARRGAISPEAAWVAASVDETPAWGNGLGRGVGGRSTPGTTAARGLRHFGATVGAEDSTWKVLFGVTTGGPTFRTVLEDL